MSILEVLQSGVKFKRDGWGNFVGPEDCPPLSIADVQAVDWVLWEPSNTISRSQFIRAWGEIYPDGSRDQCMKLGALLGLDAP